MKQTIDWRHLSRLVLVALTFQVLVSGCATTRHPTSGDPYQLTTLSRRRAARLFTLRPGEIYDRRQNRRVTFEQMMRDLRKATVVHIGEHHTALPHHRLQARIITALGWPRETLGVGLEMLPRDHQAVLDAYIRGEIDEKTMLKRVNWPRTWGFAFRLYRPLFEATRRSAGMLIALNIARQITRQVGRRGLQSLTPEQRRLVPNVYLGSTAHRALFASFMRGAFHHGLQHRLETLYQAQALWDAAMGARVLWALRHRRLEKMVVIAGSGHLIHGLGINMRIRRRAPELKQRTVIPVTVGVGGRKVSSSLGDFIVGL